MLRFLIPSSIVHALVEAWLEAANLFLLSDTDRMHAAQLLVSLGMAKLLQ